jgi:hypothetical protein
MPEEPAQGRESRVERGQHRRRAPGREGLLADEFDAGREVRRLGWRPPGEVERAPAAGDHCGGRFAGDGPHRPRQQTGEEVTAPPAATGEDDGGARFVRALGQPVEQGRLAHTGGPREDDDAGATRGRDRQKGRPQSLALDAAPDERQAAEGKESGSR